MRFADLPQGSVIAHRGGALQAPEDTLEAYRLALAQGVRVIEQDVQVLADGGLGVMHDGTLDRTTTASGNVADRTTGTWAQLRVDAGTQLGGGWRDDLRPPLFEQVLAEFAGRVLLCPEAKSPGTVAPLLDALERHGADRSGVLVQSFSLADCEAAVARGWPALWLGSDDAVRAAARGVGWLGVRARDVTAELCAGARAAGVRVACYTVDRRWERDAVRAAGVDAVFSDDPAYLHSDACERTSDAFATGRWHPGTQADGGARGTLHDDGSYAVGPSGEPAWTLLGYLRPPDPGAFALDLRVRVGAGADGGPARGASVLLTTTDRPASGGPSPGVDGYEVVVAPSGGLTLREVTGGVGGRAASAAAPPAAPGEDLRVRVVVGPAGVGATVAGGEAAALGAPAHRPLPFVHLGARGAGARYSAVVLS